jgi:hypothetical protein
MPIGHKTQLLTYSDIRGTVNVHVIVVTDVQIHGQISDFFIRTRNLLLLVCQGRTCFKMAYL